jgi:hypothetical protein
MRFFPKFNLCSITFSVAIFLLSVISCTIKGEKLIEKKRPITEEKQKTYNVVSLKNASLPLEIDFINYSIIVEIVKNKMKSLGYEISENPEIFINIGITRELSSNNKNIPNGAYAVFISPRINLNINVPLSMQSIQETFTPGRLLFDIVNVREKKYLASLITQPIVNKKNGTLISPSLLSKYIDEAFDKYFSYKKKRMSL